MSWQTYVDTNLVATGKIQKAAILGLAGGVWAISPGYSLSLAEQKAILESFKNPAATQSQGVRLADQKFFTLSAGPRSVYGKKGANGCVLVKTTQAVLVGEYQPPIQQPEAVDVVEKLADYLISVGY